LAAAASDRSVAKGCGFMIMFPLGGGGGGGAGSV